MVTSVENAHSESNIADDPVNINNRNNNRDYQAVDRDYQEDAPAFNESVVTGSNGLIAIQPDLFGQLFPVESTPADVLAAVTASHLEGFAVDIGAGVGQANIDTVTLTINNPELVKLSQRITDAADPADAESILNRWISPNSRLTAAIEFRRNVAAFRAVIVGYKLSRGPRKAYCELAANYSDVAAVIRSNIEPHLMSAGAYVRDGGLVRIVPAAGTTKAGLTLSGLTVDDHDADSLTSAVSDAIDFAVRKETRNGPLVTPCKPPADLMRMTLRFGNWPSTPYLAGVTTGPFMRPDGTPCTDAGYDAHTGWFLDYHGEPIDVPANPTLADATLAANILFDLVEQFEWSSDGQKAGWLAYLLTLVARPGINGNVPAFVFTSSTMGGGKTLLTEIANIIAYGILPSGYQAPSGESATTEWKKMLFSFALTGNPSLVVSNIESGSCVGNSVLDGVITDGRIIDRVLGQSKMRSAPWVATMAFTGNNLGTGADFAPRAIWVCLEPTVEDPRARDGFRHSDLKSHVGEFRSMLLEYCLTILCWGYQHGRAKPNADMKNSGSFEQWAAAVRFPLAHITGHDVTANGADAIVMDAATNELAAVIGGLADYSSWRSENGKSDWFAIAELHSDLNSFGNETAWPELREVLEPTASVKAFGSSAGKLIGAYRNRVCNGRKLTMRLVSKKPFWRVSQTS